MIKRWVKEYLSINKYEVSVILVLLFIGFACGIAIYFLLSTDTHTSLISTLQNTLSLSLKEEFVKLYVISNAVKINLIIVGIMLLMSITLIGKGGIYALTILKGLSIGVYACIIFNIYTFWWGILMFILLVLLVNIVYIPAYVYTSATLLAFNFDLFKTKRDNIGIFDISKVVAKVLIAFAVMFSSSILEQVFSMVAVNVYAKII